MGKVALILGLAAGYVLGTRDGRERYQQLKTQADRVVQDPRFRQKATQVQELAKKKTPLFQDRTGRAVHEASDETGNPPSADMRPTPTSTAAAGQTPIPDPQHAPDPVVGDTHV